MSKGLKFAFYLIDKNYNIPLDKLLEILEPYKRELNTLANCNLEEVYKAYWSNPDACFDEFD